MSDFTEETWRERAKRKLGEIGPWLREVGHDVPYVAYGTLAGLALWPAVEQAVTTGEAWRVLGAVYHVGAGIGASLIATQIEAWTKRGERPTETEVVSWAANGAGSDDLRDALDNIVERLEAIPAGVAALSPAEQADFRALLREELARLGSAPRFEQIITGGGAFIMGDARAARDLYAGAMNIGGHHIHDNIGPVTIVSGDDSKPTQAALRLSYLNTVFQATAHLILGDIDPKAKDQADTRLALASVYTGLLTYAEPPDTMHQRQPITPDRRATRSAVAELDSHDRLVLMGDPGSGKSTFAGFVAMCLAGQGYSDQTANLSLLTAPLPDEEGEDENVCQPWRHGPLLPALVVLRDLAAGLPNAGQEATAEHLLGFLSRRLTTAGIGDFMPYLRKEWLEKGGLLILDGLDEVMEADTCRKQIKQMVANFAGGFPHCRILVTSRTYAYQKQDWKLPGFDESTLAPFGRGQIRRFVDRWYDYVGQQRGMTADHARGQAALLKREIEARESLRGLAERPLLLTLMACLHAWHKTSLPDKREDLYHEAVDMLLDWWEKRRIRFDEHGQPVNLQPSLLAWLGVERDDMRRFLNELAFRAHSRQPELIGTADISQEELRNGLMDLAPQKVDPRQLVEYLGNRSGLLVPHGEAVYTFPHRTFQEYLAACYLTDHHYPRQLATLLRTDWNRWREAVLLAAAKVYRGTSYAVWPLVDALCPLEPPGGDGGEPDADAWGALLAGQVIEETTKPDERAEDANRPKVERVRRWQKALLAHPALPDNERAAAGVALAVLGDDRPEVMAVDAMQFCLVPGGPFRMGEDKSLHTNAHLSGNYWLGRYPVSNAQFEAFVAGGGYDHAGYWPEAAAAGRWKQGRITDWGTARSQPYDYGRPYSLPNHPVVGITWYEALAFTRWLTARWREAGKLPGDWEIRLPSEAEWEKAARGGLMIPVKEVVRAAGEWTVAAPRMMENPDKERRHPWTGPSGTHHANTKESTINSTGAAGLFPPGRSPCGCEEMAGTVWEWTRSLYDFKYPYVPDKKRENLGAGVSESRVLRGGAYYSELDACRCAQRGGFSPYRWLDAFGFRALAAPSTSVL